MGCATYILNGHKAVKCDDHFVWAQQLGVPGARVVANDQRNGKTVSTVFLGMDHSPEEGDDHPLLFETMIFNDGELEIETMMFNDGDEYCVRYETWEEAEEGHLAACVIAFGPEDEITKKKIELKEKVIFDKTMDDIVDGMLDE